MHNIVINIKSALDKDKNRFYYKLFLEKCSYQLSKKQSQIFVHSIIMLKLGEREREREREREILKETFYAAKNLKNLGCW